MVRLHEAAKLTPGHAAAPKLHEAAGVGQFMAQGLSAAQAAGQLHLGRAHLTQTLFGSGLENGSCGLELLHEILADQVQTKRVLASLIPE